jgi:hypothetical protein
MKNISDRPNVIKKQLYTQARIQGELWGARLPLFAKIFEIDREILI